MARAIDNSSQMNWFDRLKDLNDPDNLYDLYIKNLKEEQRLLNT